MSRKLLVITTAGTLQVRFDHQITIGRDSFNSLSLHDPEVSRSHAIIFEHEDACIIRDLHSRNGVYVRGERVPEATLCPGDEMILGSTIIFFEPPEEFNLHGALSRRGTFLLSRRRQDSAQPENDRAACIQTAAEMNRALQSLFSDPERTTYFTLDTALMLLGGIKQMNEAADARALFDATLHAALTMLGGHRGVIMETDAAKKQLKVRALSSTGDSTSMIVAKAVLQHVLIEEKAICCPDIRRDRRFERLAERSGRPLHSFVASPIHASEEMFGFIYLDSEDEAVSYQFPDLRALYFIALHLGALLRVRPGHFAHHPRPEDHADRISIIPLTHPMKK